MPPRGLPGGRWFQPQALCRRRSAVVTPTAKMGPHPQAEVYHHHRPARRHIGPKIALVFGPAYCRLDSLHGARTVCHTIAPAVRVLVQAPRSGEVTGAVMRTRLFLSLDCHCNDWSPPWSSCDGAWRHCTWPRERRICASRLTSCHCWWRNSSASTCSPATCSPSATGGGTWSKSCTGAAAASAFG